MLRNEPAILYLPLVTILGSQELKLMVRISSQLDGLACPFLKMITHIETS